LPYPELVAHREMFLSLVRDSPSPHIL
jgi:hypothetical protein